MYLFILERKFHTFSCAKATDCTRLAPGRSQKGCSPVAYQGKQRSENPGIKWVITFYHYYTQISDD